MSLTSRFVLMRPTWIVVAVFLAVGSLCWESATGQTVDSRQGGTSPQIPPNTLRVPTSNEALPPHMPLADPARQPVSGGLQIGGEPVTPQGIPTPATPGQQDAPGYAAQSDRPAPTTAIKPDEIAAQIEAVQQATDLDDATRAELLKRYGKAAEHLKVADETTQAISLLETEIQQGPQLIKDAKNFLSSATPEPDVRMPADATLPALEGRLNQVELQLKADREELARTEERLKRRVERSTELTKLISDLQRRIEETQAGLQGLPIEGENETLTFAKRVELETKLVSLEKQQVQLTTEVRRNEALSELFPLQRDRANRIAKYREKEFAAWQRLVADQRKIEAERQAREARRQVENAHPALRDLAERNAELAELRTTLAKSIESVQGEIKKTAETLKKVQGDFETTQEKVSRASQNSTIGVMLRKQRESLPKTWQCEQRLKAIGQEIPRLQLKLIELREERAPLGDPESLAREVINDLELSISQVDPAYLERTVVSLLETKRDLLDKLINDYDVSVKEMIELELELADLVSAANEFGAFIDEHVLWIRSDDPVSLGMIPETLKGITTLVTWQNWVEVGKRLYQDFRARPGFAFAAFCLAIIFYPFGHRLRRRLRAICDTTKSRGQMRFLPTIEGLAIAAVLSAQWPFVLAFIGWRMNVASGDNEFMAATSAAVILVAMLLGACVFIRIILRSEGLGATHFHWPASVMRTMRWHVGWLSLVGMSLAFIVTFSHQFRDGAFAGSMGRVAFICDMICLAVFCHAVLNPKGRLFRELVERESSWLYRVRHVVYVGCQAAMLSLAGLACFGYYYSATQLVVRLQTSAAAVGAAILTHAVASRWFLVKRRNLAIRQARERLASSQEQSGIDSALNVKIEQPDLSEIHANLKSLLRYAVTIGLLLSGWVIWSDVLPALRALDRVELWSTSVEVTEFVQTPNGDEVAQTNDVSVKTTLRHLVVAILIGGMTVLIGRRLPALLEITILERLPIDVGGRHAASVITRYVVTLTGVILACRTLHISWSSVQWLAAAMTVGLGFGMQEIFANFVSGLIILFERPVRVGDLVTVGGVTGRVSRTQIRATTITDFDRRELIVPNKKFITDDVMNWTLSDHVNRVVIEVGVAYGSNVAKTREIMLGVALRNPLVLHDPEPTVTFDRFGDSALNFTLRCYLPNLDNRLEVIHHLHAKIDDEFRAADIEIAFPQQEIRIREVDRLIAGIRPAPSKRADAA